MLATCGWLTYPLKPSLPTIVWSLTVTSALWGRGGHCGGQGMRSVSRRPAAHQGVHQVLEPVLDFHCEGTTPSCPPAPPEDNQPAGEP